MPREYHSPSSDSLGRRCVRAWGYRYIEGRKPPEVEWPVIEAAGAGWANVATPSQRSLALGKAIHAKAEAYFLQRPGTDYTDLPGEIFLSGAHLLPHPSRLAVAPRVEHAIGEAHIPEVEGLWHRGVRWLGYVDLRVLPIPEESDRLGLPRGWVTFDYKSTKDPKWIKTPDQLRADGQANLYGWDEIMAHECGGPSIMRWVYFRTQGKREARAVDFTIDHPAALAELDAMTDRALYLDEFESVERMPPNPSACGDYGGCEYHHSKGGPCSARAKLGAMIQARIPHRKEDHIMPGFLEKHRANKAAAAAGQPLPYPDMGAGAAQATHAAVADQAVQPPPVETPVAAPPEPPPAGANGPAEPPPAADPAPAKKGPGRPRATPSAGVAASSPDALPQARPAPGAVTCELRVQGSPAALVDLLQRFPA